MRNNLIRTYSVRANRLAASVCDPVHGNEPDTPDTKGMRTRDRILDAALELFSQSGSNGVSLRSIAKQANISHAGLLRYFKNKDELILAAIARRDRIPGALEVSDYDAFDPQDYIPLFLEAIQKNMSNPGSVALFVKIATEATDPEHPAHAYFEDRYALITDKITESVVAILDCPEHEARKRAQEFIAFVDGIQIQWLLRPRDIDMLEATREYLQRVHLL